jgi:hypothetical protein
MPELLIQTCPGERDADDRFVLVTVDIQDARVQRVSEAVSGHAMRGLPEARGEPSWCIAARMALARQQMADADCRPSELAVRISSPQTESTRDAGHRSM